MGLIYCRGSEKTHKAFAKQGRAQGLQDTQPHPHHIPGGLTWCVVSKGHISLLVIKGQFEAGPAWLQKSGGRIQVVLFPLCIPGWRPARSLALAFLEGSLAAFCTDWWTKAIIDTGSTCCSLLKCIAVAAAAHTPVLLMTFCLPLSQACRSCCLRTAHLILFYCPIYHKNITCFSCSSKWKLCHLGDFPSYT